MPSDLGISSRPSSPATLDDGTLRKDKNYRKFASAIEKALSLFDTNLQEWADYISFLGRLLKALQTRPQGVGDVPYTKLVAKRLAQCLDPRLPSGVHQKALEVYAFVFSILQKDGLARELSLYLPGLSPTLSFASLSVKPLLLSLFEDYVLLLDGISLQPASKAILLALLPGLEEETSEEFERTHTLITQFRDALAYKDGNSYAVHEGNCHKRFWQSLFLAAITSASRRPGALQYLARNLPVLGPELRDPKQKQGYETAKHEDAVKTLPSDIQDIISPEPGLLVRSFAAGLRDDQILVQRGFLDLLVTKLPLSSAVLQHAVKSQDLELLISAAISVVGRRDMSLNRRLWAWFLGPESTRDGDGKLQSTVGIEESTSRAGSFSVNQDSQVSYFQNLGLDPLTNSVQKMIGEISTSPVLRARPFRVSLSLMDRSEIGNLIVPRIFMPIMNSIFAYERVAPSKESFTEVLRSAHVFFDGVQSNLIWAAICKAIFDSLEELRLTPLKSASDRARQRLDLIWFIISKFNVREEEMLIVHMPRASLIILSELRASVAIHPPIDGWNLRECYKTALKIATRLVDFMPERTFSDRSPKLEQDPLHEADANFNDQMQIDAKSILQTYDRGESERHPITRRLVGRDLVRLLLGNSSELLVEAVESRTKLIEIDQALPIMSKIIRKVPQNFPECADRLIPSVLQSSTDVLRQSDDVNTFATVAGLVSIFEFLSKIVVAQEWTTNHQLRTIATNLIRSLWAFLSPGKPQHTVEATRCLWRINPISPSPQLVESTICSMMLKKDEAGPTKIVTLDGAKNFAILWTQTNSRLRPSSDKRSSLGRTKKPEDKSVVADAEELDMLARPLSLFLDTVSEKSNPASTFSLSWLQSLANIQIIMDFLVRRFQNCVYISRISDENGSESAQLQLSSTDERYAAKECSYHILRISNLLKLCPDTASASLMSRMIPSEIDMERKAESVSEDQAESSTQEEASAPLIGRFLLIRVTQILEQQFKHNALSEMSLEMCQAALGLLQQLVRENREIILQLDLDESLLKLLMRSIEISALSLQKYLIDAFLSIISESVSTATAMLRRKRADHPQSLVSTDSVEKPHLEIEQRTVKHSSMLLECLISGLSSTRTRPVLDHWVNFLGHCLPYYESQTFQILIPLVDCFRSSLEQIFEALRSAFTEGITSLPVDVELINTLNILLNGLEQLLGRSHEQLRREEANIAPLKSPEQSQGFFGNMVSGVFASDAQESRSATANDRLTVLICFKDAVRVAFRLWSWGENSTAKLQGLAGSSASFNYASIRLRNRARRLLENLFSAEPLESLETLVETWQRKDTVEKAGSQPPTLSLLHTLDSSRPKNTIPTTFNALYSRTSPASLDSNLVSTLTSELSESDLAGFLVAYLRSIDDDALDEIWIDCLTFARNVLANPMPQRQILPKLLEFVAILGEKIDNTNFGEQRRMRKEIGDLFTRLLAATFTVRPLSFLQESVQSQVSEKVSDDSIQVETAHNRDSVDDVVTIIASTLPNIITLLKDTDRIIPVCTTVSMQVFGPTLRSRRFPQIVTASTLAILKTLSKVTEVTRLWRKDVTEAFNDSRFFGPSSLALVHDGWAPVIKHWAVLDKDRMPELLSRLIAPTSAGIVFGVGASSARLEADRKTQLNLRRIAFVLVAGDTDDFLVNVSNIQEKLVELSNATPSSSPSSIIKAEVAMVFRALILKISPVHLSSLWPILNSELFDSFASLTIEREQRSSSHSVTCILQAAKLLDLILAIGPEDFQLREWLFVTDTVEAVYRSPDWKPIALVDKLAEELDTNATGLQDNQSIEGRSGSGDMGSLSTNGNPQEHYQQGTRRPLLRWDNIQGVPRDQAMIDRILRPFLRQLSIAAFESTYQMEIADREACTQELLKDLFDESTLV